MFDKGEIHVFDSEHRANTRQEAEAKLGMIWKPVRPRMSRVAWRNFLASPMWFSG